MLACTVYAQVDVNRASSIILNAEYKYRYDTYLQKSIHSTKRLTMSLNAVSKHIKVLESAGLVSRKKLGGEHLIEANLEPVKAIDRWFQELRSIWEIRLEKLEKLLVVQQTDFAAYGVAVGLLEALPLFLKSFVKRSWAMQ